MSFPAESGLTRTPTMTFPFPSFALELLLLSGCASSVSSKVVAEVEYESWAEELRLCAGEGMLIPPSECLAPAPDGIDFPSPLPLRRLGVRDPV